MSEPEMTEIDVIGLHNIYLGLVPIDLFWYDRVDRVAKTSNLQ